MRKNFLSAYLTYKPTEHHMLWDISYTMKNRADRSVAPSTSVTLTSYLHNDEHESPDPLNRACNHLQLSAASCLLLRLSQAPHLVSDMKAAT